MSINNNLGSVEISAMNSILQGVMNSKGFFSTSTKYLQVVNGSFRAVEKKSSKASVSEIAQQVEYLKKVDIDTSDTDKFNEMMYLFKNVALKEGLQDRSGTINALFDDAFRSSEEPSTKNTVLYHIYGESIKDEGILKRGKELGLSESETLAVFSYTSDLYLIMNPFLRGQNEIFKDQAKELHEVIQKCTNSSKELTKMSQVELIERLKKEIPLTKIELTKGINKIPPYKGMAYRGDILTTDELERFKSGKYSDSTVLSFSKNHDTSLSWTFRYPTNKQEEHRAFIAVRSNNARCIDCLSASPDEEEVVYAPRAEFEVEMLEKKSKLIDGQEVEYTEIILREKE